MRWSNGYEILSCVGDKFGLACSVLLVLEIKDISSPVGRVVVGAIRANGIYKETGG
jgi:hypothetical protein